MNIFCMDINSEATGSTEVGRILASHDLLPVVSLVVMVLCGKRDFADIIKVTNQLTLK